MWNSRAGRVSRRAFTLVEVLVTTVVVGVLAAVIIPAVISQATAADPARVAQDLGAVKSGIEVFSQNVRPRMPGDIEDLINPISVSDKGADGTVYTSTQASLWKGPYVEWTTPTSTTQTTTDVIFKSAGSAQIISSLYRCPTAQTYFNTSTASADSPCDIYTATTGNLTDAYVAVKVTGMTASSTEFTDFNEIFDGVDETLPGNNGLVRQNSSGTVFFLAVPYDSP